MQAKILPYDRGLLIAVQCGPGIYAGMKITSGVPGTPEVSQYIVITPAETFLYCTSDQKRNGSDLPCYTTSEWAPYLEMVGRMVRTLRMTYGFSLDHHHHDPLLETPCAPPPPRCGN